ncbi:hypothetical protein HDK90DRAFT_86795 [Phyllosticta capitalensis]|uniref:Uncharacterized protein n=1 Tax=Phyllosticta capitalensis TaxID=121624 RepID=A0ABR1YB54_9PEZI
MGSDGRQGTFASYLRACVSLGSLSIFDHVLIFLFFLFVVLFFPSVHRPSSNSSVTTYRAQASSKPHDYLDDSPTTYIGALRLSPDIKVLRHAFPPPTNQRLAIKTAPRAGLHGARVVTSVVVRLATRLTVSRVCGGCDWWVGVEVSGEVRDGWVEFGASR